MLFPAFLLKKTMSQNRKPLNTSVSRVLRIQNKGVQSVEAHDESPARLSLFIPLVRRNQRLQTSLHQQNNYGEPYY